jgi:hypothetical protein
MRFVFCLGHQIQVVVHKHYKPWNLKYASEFEACISSRLPSSCPGRRIPLVSPRNQFGIVSLKCTCTFVSLDAQSPRRNSMML